MKLFTKYVWLVLSFVLLSSVHLEAQTVTRGPYLQMGNTSAVTVRWRTSTSTNTVVRYGTVLGSLTQSASNSTSTTEHELRLNGLAANTKYYYSIGTSTTTLASGSDCFFVTAPTSAKPTRVWVLGDSGNLTAAQSRVRDAYYKFAGTRHTDLWLMLGDNAYNSGLDSEYQSKLFNVYKTMLQKSVLWPTFGNHDAVSANSATQTGPYFDMLTLPKAAEAGGVASGTEAYYSFDYGNIHFVCLDSSESSRATTGAMLSWLKRDLAQNTKTWTVAFWHHPPYSKGSHDSDTETELVEMRKNAGPILESYGVDLVLSGHSHSYERSRFINGHYGLSTTFQSSSMVVQTGSGQADGSGAYAKASSNPTPFSGTVYVVAGTSAHKSGGLLNHPAMYSSQNILGSVVLDFDNQKLDVQFLDDYGVRRDYFTLTKGSAPANTPPSVALTSPAAGSTYLAPATMAVTASASDPDGIMRVDFYSGSQLLGGTTKSPYSVTWTGASAGTYSLTAKATDSLGLSRTSAPVSISVGGTSPNAVTSLTLINADTDKPITGYETIANGAVIRRSALPTTRLSIRFNTSPATVGSVKIDYDAKTSYRIESEAPYALFGDTKGDFNPGTIANGTHTVRGTPYTLSSAKGTAGTALTVSFTIQ